MDLGWSRTHGRRTRGTTTRPTLAGNITLSGNIYAPSSSDTYRLLPQMPVAIMHLSLGVQDFLTGELKPKTRPRPRGYH